jgi:hypothetical protein
MERGRGEDGRETELVERRGVEVVWGSELAGMEQQAGRLGTVVDASSVWADACTMAWEQAGAPHGDGHILDHPNYFSRYMDPKDEDGAPPPESTRHSLARRDHAA